MTAETYSTDYAICPYCDHRNSPSDSDGFLYDEGTTTYDCGECGREFVVSVHVSYSWTCEPMPEDR